PANDPRSQLGYSLALLPGDSGQVDYLYQRLLTADAAEMGVLRGALKPYRDRILPMLLAELAKGSATREEEVGAEQAKDRLAERKARAAVALVGLGEAQKVWP